MTQFNADLQIDVQSTAAERQIQKLERQLSQLQAAAQRALNLNPAGIINSLAASNKLTKNLKEQTRELEKQARLGRSRGGGGGGSRSGADPRINAEVSNELNRQLQALGARARALRDNQQIAGRLLAIEQELNRENEANLSLVQKQVTNASRLLREEERRAAAVQKGLEDEQRLRDKIAQKEAREAQKRVREAEKIGRARASAAQKGLASLGTALTGGGGLGGALTRGVAGAGGLLGGIGLSKFLEGVNRSQQAQAELFRTLAEKTPFGIGSGSFDAVANAVPQLPDNVETIARQIVDLTGDVNLAAAAFMAFGAAAASPMIAKGAVAGVKLLGQGIAKTAEVTGQAAATAAKYAMKLGTVEMELKAVALASKAFGDQIKRNIDLSRRARESSGFADFSQNFQRRIDDTAAARATRKAIERRERRRPKPVEPPLPRTLLGPGNDLGEVRFRLAKKNIQSKREESKALIRIQKKEAAELLRIKRAQVAGEQRLNLRRQSQAVKAAEATKKKLQGIQTGILSGLSFAPIPGQNIFQSGLAGSALGGSAGFAAGAGIAALVSAATALPRVLKEGAVAASSSEQRIRALSEGFDDYREVLAVASRAAEKFNISTLESRDAIAQLFGRLRPLGLTLEEVETVYNGFNTAAALTGATATESAGALLQLSQALGAGALRGEEFNSVAEQAPAVIQAIAKEIDKPVGQLKALAKEGQLTSDIVIKALERIDREGAQRLAEALDTPAQKFKLLENRIEDLKIAIGNLALADTIALVDGLAIAADGAAKDVNTLALAQANLKRKLDKSNDEVQEFLNKFPTFRDLIPLAVKIVDALSTAFDNLGKAALRNIPGVGQFVLLLEAAAKLKGVLDGFAADEVNARLQAGQDGFIGPPAPRDPRSLRERLGLDEDDGSGSGTGNGAEFDAKRVRDGIRAGDLADRENEARRLAIRNQDQLLDRLNAQLRVQNSLTDKDRILNELLLEQLEIRQDIANKIEESDPALKQSIIREGELRSRLALDINTRVFFDAGASLGADLAGKIDEANARLTETDKILNGVGATLTDGLVRGLTAAVTETDRLGEAFQNLAAEILNSIGQALILAGIQGALSSLGGNDGGVGFFSKLFPKREKGGPVEADRPFIVGEKGPELFVPNQRGQVLSNDDSKAFVEAAGALRGGGSAATTDEADEAFSAAAQANQIIRNNSRDRIQERNTETFFEQSVAQMGTSKPIEVRLQEVVINEQRFTTPEQTMEAMKKAAEQARAQVFADMKNKPSVRRSLGM